MTTEEIMMSFPITRKAWNQAGLIFSGIAIPCDKTTVEGGTIRSEKVIKFNRTALRNGGVDKVEKVDPRYNGGDDTMIVKVGKPGSRERVEALRSQYEAIESMGEEISPFAWEG
jgi:tRNA G37 N-methylase TrmD